MDEAIHTTWQWVQLLSGIAVVVFLGVVIVGLVAASVKKGKDDG